MTIAQEIAAQAWEETLALRGVDLTIGSSVVRAVVDATDPDQNKYIAGQGEREKSRVFVARAEVPIGIQPGDTFEDDDGYTHRIVEIKDNPTSIKIVFTCETSREE